MLVIDLAANGSAGPDGVIDQDRELVFTRWSQSATSDMAALREVFDTNHNGMLDAGDARFSEFRIWRDANQNGKVDPGELKTLADLGIASIDLQPHGTPVGIGDGGTRVNGFSSFTRLDGTHGLAADLSLAYNTDGFQVAATANGFSVDWQDGTGQRYFVAPDMNAAVTLDLATNNYFAAFGSNANDTFIGANGRANNIEAGLGDDHLTGGDQTDILLGDGGSDTLSGGAGNDILDGGTGLNRLDGGAGSDIALFGGPAANYTWVSSNGQIFVRSLDGSENDTLSNVEFLVFADQVIAAANVAIKTPHWSASVDNGAHPAGWVPVATGDFNHDGASDVLWFNAGNGDVDLWTIAGGHWAGSVDIGPHPAGWVFAASGDFNGDGTPDVLWYNPTSGDAEAWKIANGQWAGSVDIGPHPLGWQLAGTGDFNADGTSDVLWYQQSDGGTDVWIISNAQWAGSVYVGPHPLGWQPVGTGDFDHDGTSDVLWYNPATGNVDLWKMSNGHWAASVDMGAQAAGWTPAGIGDFNGDGTSDIAWFNASTGGLEVWLISNGQWAASVNLGNHPTGWLPAGIGDFNADGISDILWREAGTNHVETWLLGADDPNRAPYNTITGNDNNNAIYGNDGNDTLIGGAGNDYIDGGAGSDTVDYSNNPAPGHGIAVDLAAGTASNGVNINDTLISIENVIGTSTDDILTGSSADNSIAGGGGNDSIAGGAGNDTINGGAGSDTVDYSNNPAPGHGIAVDLGGGWASNGVNINDTLISIENVIGTSTNDILIGSSADNSFSAGAGNNSINGGAGSDTVDYSNNPAPGHGIAVDLGAGTASNGVNINDTLISIENVIGMSTDDIIAASTAINTLTGNGGNDVFVFHAGGAQGDTITDFDGQGAAQGDSLQFVGYGTAAQGANLTQVDATHWSINSADGLTHEIIALSNGANVHSTDILFL